MTANVFEEDRQKALDAGLNGHIAKPIDIANLMKVLKEALKRKKILGGGQNDEG